MNKKDYAISKEFFPFDHFTPPMSRTAIRQAQKTMKPPKSLWRDSDLVVRSVRIPAYQDGEIDMLLIGPRDLALPAPCFLDLHGGGFVFEAFTSHYRHAATYAKEGRCMVAFPLYRLAPAFPYPYPQEDAYAALAWLYAHADEAGIDPARIGIGGDSAGGMLAVTSCLMARDRGAGFMPLFQLLIYPFLDDSKKSDSYQTYTDTPMWNSSLSRAVGPMVNPHPEEIPLAYRSPAEAEDLSGLPPAYIEVAEFDPLHDDGILFTRLLNGNGIAAELHETTGTMHGFDTKVTAPTSKKMVSERAAYIRQMFYTGG